MPTFYIYNQVGADQGPFTLDELRAQVTSGQVPSDILTRNADSPDWKPISDFLPDLAGFLHPNPGTANRSAAGPVTRPGIFAALGLRICAWLYLAASLVTGIRYLSDSLSRNMFGDLTTFIGLGIIFQGGAALCFFLVLAAISDNVRAIASK